MSAKVDQAELVAYWAARCQELLQTRNNLAREDLEYLAEKAEKLKDERMKACIAELIGWDDDDRAELETFCAIAIELMKSATPSRMREAARIVELRFYLKGKA
jgi:hypothetical protein